jgi:hypothetical protein
MRNFISVFENVGTEEFCNKTLEHWNRVTTIKRTEHDNVSSLLRDNQIYFLQTEQDKDLSSFNTKLLNEFSNLLLPAFEKYKKENSTALDGLKKYALNADIKLQKTIPGEGYHTWHCESDCLATSKRIMLVFMYLNNCEEGGETEFLYQNKRIEARQGRLVIAPADWTHIHRGNPPLKGEKFMMNGWIEFVE